MSNTRLSSELYKQLRSAGTPIAQPKGRVLFHSGDPVRGAFLIRRGRVRMKLGHSACYPARVLGSGNIIGLPATFSGEPYSLTAEAESNCNLDFIPRAKLLELLRHKPKAGFRIVRILSEEIFQMRKAVTPKSGGTSVKSRKCKPRDASLKKKKGRSGIVGD